MTTYVLQCQACTKTSTAPEGWGTYIGPWRCPFCKATHTIRSSVGTMDTIRLLDRFAPGVFNCSPAVTADLTEAISAYNAYAPRASVVMIRRALESACIEKGAKGRNLAEKIKDLHERLKVFDTAHVSLATATRHFGNFGAHPNDD